MPAKPKRKKEIDKKSSKESLQEYKNSIEYILKQYLRRKEALKLNAKVI
jgi:hypothetical protein